MRYHSLTDSQQHFLVQKCAWTASQTLRDIFCSKMRHRSLSDTQGYFLIKNALPQPLRHSDTVLGSEICCRSLTDIQGQFFNSKMRCRSLIYSWSLAYLLELTSRAYCLCYSGNDPTYRIRKSRLSEFEHFDGGHKMASPLGTKDCQASGWPAMGSQGSRAPIE